MNAIVYSCSNEYAYLAGISLLSCLEKNTKLDDVCVFILDNNICDENKLKLTSIAKKYKISLTFINMSLFIQEISKNGMVKGHMSSSGLSYATYSRLFIDELLPDNIVRVIYIDCDTLVVGNIGPLFSMDMKTKSIVMACD